MERAAVGPYVYDDLGLNGSGPLFEDEVDVVGVLLSNRGTLTRHSSAVLGRRRLQSEVITSVVRMAISFPANSGGSLSVNTVMPSGSVLHFTDLCEC